MIAFASTINSKNSCSDSVLVSAEYPGSLPYLSLPFPSLPLFVLSILKTNSQEVQAGLEHTTLRDVLELLIHCSFLLS